MPERGTSPGARRLAAAHRSLAYGVSSQVPKTIYALAVSGGIAVPPGDNHQLLFGRNRPEVDVCVGEDDQEVSRAHGMIAHRRGLWWVGNIGKRPIRLAGRYLFPGEEEIPLEEGYTPLFVGGSRSREHLLELYVTGDDGTRPAARHRDATRGPKIWRLTPEERLSLIVLGQKYLLHDFYPQPLSYRETAEYLADLQPDAGWTEKVVEHHVANVRRRLSRGNVHGLTRKEVGRPVGSKLNENLFRELLLSTTLVPRDLALLDAMADATPDD